MSSMSIYCIKDCNIKTFVTTVKRIDPDLFSEPNFIEYAHNGSNLSLRFHAAPGQEYDAVKSFCSHNDLNWINLIFQQSTLWEYVAYRGDKELDLFSTCRAYWEDEDDQSLWLGNPELIAEAYGVPVSRIQNYYQVWDLSVSSFERNERAYPNDQCLIGDFHQGSDFLKAIG